MHELTPGPGGDPVELAAGPTRLSLDVTSPFMEPTRLSPRVIDLDRLIGRVTTLVLGGVAVLAAVGTIIASRWPWWGDLTVVTAAVAAVALLAWHLQRWPAIDYAHTSFTADAEALVIRRGVFWRHVISVPRSRVQHTDVSQGPLERRYDLGTVVIYTAGHQHAQVTLRGVEYATALAIRDLLLPQHRHDVV